MGWLVRSSIFKQSDCIAVYECTRKDGKVVLLYHFPDGCAVYVERVRVLSGAPLLTAQLKAMELVCTD